MVKIGDHSGAKSNSGVRGKFLRDRLSTRARALKVAQQAARALGGGAITVHDSRGRLVQTIPIAQRSRPATRPHYRMEIAWSGEDNAYLVTVPDLPGCVTHGATYADAARMGEEAIDLWLEGARHWGRPIPLPDSAKAAV